MPSRSQPLVDAGPFEQIDGALLEHAGADAALDVLAAAVLEHDRSRSRRRASSCASVSPAGPAPTIADLGSATVHASSSTRCAIANARFAAGTPQ